MYNIHCDQKCNYLMHTNSIVADKYNNMKYVLVKYALQDLKAKTKILHSNTISQACCKIFPFGEI